MSWKEEWNFDIYGWWFAILSKRHPALKSMPLSTPSLRMLLPLLALATALGVAATATAVPAAANAAPYTPSPIIGVLTVPFSSATS